MINIAAEYAGNVVFLKGSYSKNLLSTHTFKFYQMLGLVPFPVSSGAMDTPHFLDERVWYL